MKCIRAVMTTLTFTLFTNLAFAANNHYKIIIDAGSTGSRLHVYQYDPSTPVPEIDKVFSENTKPGLSSFADNPTAAAASLKNLLDNAGQYLDKKGARLQDVEVNILATAGMRLIAKDKQQAIFKNITSYLKNNYSFAIGQINTISGTMEGLYGWLDVNYLLGNFKHHRDTVGSIDMGGASTQIAFASTALFNPLLISLTINQQKYQVFSKSFTKLGQEQSLAAVMQNKNAANCFPQNYAYLENRTGHFNREACSPVYEQILEKNKVKQQLISTEGQSFVAYTGIFYTFNFLGVDKTPARDLLEARIEAVCHQDWELLKKAYPAVPDKYLASYCAHAVYEDQLLFNAYKLQDSQLIITDKLDKQDIDWTLGALLYSLVKADGNRYSG